MASECILLDGGLLPAHLWQGRRYVRRFPSLRRGNGLAHIMESNLRLFKQSTHAHHMPCSSGYWPSDIPPFKRHDTRKHLPTGATQEPGFQHPGCLRSIRILRRHLLRRCHGRIFNLGLVFLDRYHLLRHNWNNSLPLNPIRHQRETRSRIGIQD